MTNILCLNIHPPEKFTLWKSPYINHFRMILSASFESDWTFWFQILKEGQLKNTWCGSHGDWASFKTFYCLEGKLINVIV